MFWVLVANSMRGDCVGVGALTCVYLCVCVCVCVCKCVCLYSSSLYKLLTLNFLVAVVNTLNTKTHSSKEIAEFCFKNAGVKSICYCKQRMKSKLSLSSECVETKLCKPCT